MAPPMNKTMSSCVICLWHPKGYPVYRTTNGGQLAGPGQQPQECCIGIHLFVPSKRLSGISHDSWRPACWPRPTAPQPTQRIRISHLDGPACWTNTLCWWRGCPKSPCGPPFWFSPYVPTPFRIDSLADMVGTQFSRHGRHSRHDCLPRA